MQSFAHFGYETLCVPYAVTLTNLNADAIVPVQIYDLHRRCLCGTTCQFS
jgi:hypothetical protein